MFDYRALFVTTLFQKISVVIIALLLLPSSSLAATLRISPGSGSYQAGSTFSVSVIVDCSDTACNALSGKLSFPNDSLEVSSLSKTSSIISLWVQEPSFSNNEGTISFEGIALNPGYTGNSGRVITVNFRAKKESSATVAFLAGEILANDGVGTSIISAKTGGAYSLVPAKVVPVKPTEGTAPVGDAPTAPKVLSDSHPENAWSSQTTGTFSFEFEKDITAVRLLVDKNASSVPAVLYQPPIAKRTIDDIAEGVSYLHVQTKNAKGWGGVTHYLLQVDTKNPQPPLFSEKWSDAEGQTKIFVLSALDEESGIDRFEISLDGKEKNTISASSSEVTYVTPELTSGQHQLSVRVFDKAGNFSEASKEFQIVSGQPNTPNITAPSFYQNLVSVSSVLVTILSLVIPVAALLTVLLWICLQAWKIVRRFKRAFKKELLEAKIMAQAEVIHMRDERIEEVALLLKTKTKRILTKEERKILKQSQKSIAQVENFLHHKNSDETEQLEQRHLKNKSK